MRPAENSFCKIGTAKPRLLHSDSTAVNVAHNLSGVAELFSSSHLTMFLTVSA
jgi:hypothetical protein